MQLHLHRTHLRNAKPLWGEEWGAGNMGMIKLLSGPGKATGQGFQEERGGEEGGIWEL